MGCSCDDHSLAGCGDANCLPYNLLEKLHACYCLLLVAIDGTVGGELEVRQGLVLTDPIQVPSEFEV